MDDACTVRAPRQSPSSLEHVRVRRAHSYQPVLFRPLPTRETKQAERGRARPLFFVPCWRHCTQQATPVPASQKPAAVLPLCFCASVGARLGKAPVLPANINLLLLSRHRACVTASPSSQRKKRSCTCTTGPPTPSSNANPGLDHAPPFARRCPGPVPALRWRGRQSPVGHELVVRCLGLARHVPIAILPFLCHVRRQHNNNKSGTVWKATNNAENVECTLHPCFAQHKKSAW